MNDVIDAEVTETALVKASEKSAMQMAFSRPPEVVLDEARKAARALQDVIEGKEKKVTFNGETYLEYEDWQTLGRFYGVTAKIESTDFVQFGEVKGFQARAVAIRGDGMEISGAEAMCLNDERNWGSKPLFQLRSMAQTRACAKVLRNVLAWVVVMAGYRPTPAEEMEVVTSAVRQGTRQPPASIEPPPTPSPECQVVLDEIKKLMSEAWPTKSAEHKKAKAEALNFGFGTVSWNAVQALPLDTLKAGLASIKSIGEQNAE